MRNKNSKITDEEHRVLDSDKCKGCGGDVGPKDKALECKSCEKWYCITCLKIPENLYDCLSGKSEVEALEVTCPACRDTPSIQEMLIKLSTQQNETITKIEGMENKIADSVKEVVKTEVEAQVVPKIEEAKEELRREMKAEMLKLENRVQNEIQSRSDRAAGGETEGAVGGLSDIKLEEKIQNLVEEASREARDKEQRKPNIILYRAKELKNGEMEARKEHDQKLVREVIQAINLPVDKEVKIQAITRLGKPLDEGTRPLKVTLANPPIRHDIVKKAHLLGSSRNPNLQPIKIAYDRTVKEKKNYSQLRQELERRKMAGETGLVIRRGKIVRVDEIQERGPMGEQAPNQSRVGVTPRRSDIGTRSKHSTPTPRNIGSVAKVRKEGQPGNLGERSLIASVSAIAEETDSETNLRFSDEESRAPTPENTGAIPKVKKPDVLEKSMAILVQEGLENGEIKIGKQKEGPKKASLRKGNTRITQSIKPSKEGETNS